MPDDSNARSTTGGCIRDSGFFIGIENYFKFLKAQNLTNTVYLIPSVFGNLIAGTNLSRTESETSVTTCLQVDCIGSESEGNLSDMVNRFLDLDSIGIREFK